MMANRFSCMSRIWLLMRTSMPRCMSFLARLPKALTHFTEVDVNSAFPGLKVSLSSAGSSFSVFLFALRSIVEKASSRPIEALFLLFFLPEEDFLDVADFRFKSGKEDELPLPKSGRAGAVSEEENKDFILPTILSSPCSLCSSCSKLAGGGSA